jgi:hypothetical protein
MREVVIQLPTYDAEQNVDIEVRINGKNRTFHYRVEIIAWEDFPEEQVEKVDIIKQVIMEHDKDWRLMQIGIPTEKNIPIMFRRKAEKTKAVLPS